MTHELTGISEAKFAEIAAIVKARTGLVLEGNAGTAEKQGFTVRYQYDPAAQTLALELLKKPWFVPQSLIDNKIAEYMKGDGQAFLSKPPAEQA